MNQHSIAITEVGRLSLSLRVFPWCIVSNSKRKVPPPSGNGAPTVLPCYLFLFFLCHDLFLLEGPGGSMFPDLCLISHQPPGTSWLLKVGWARFSNTLFFPTGPVSVVSLSHVLSRRQLRLTKGFPFF